MTVAEQPHAGPAPRGSLHDAAAARLRDLIVEGELAPGARLNERVLCERFGLSRTPLREAVKVLAAEGLIELSPRRGARVARLGRAEAAHLFEVIGTLEALSGRLACRHASTGELAEIRALHFEMLAHYARRRMPDYFRLNQAIHAAILDAARNPVLRATHRALAERLRPARYMANLSDERWAAAVDEHHAILAALEARDGARLAALLEAHLRNKAAVVCEALPEG